MNIEEILKNKATTLVDVRSTDEFEEGSIPGAINIPLHTIPVRLDEIKALNTPAICFCRSGARSYQAVTWLKKQGIEVFDGGGIGNLQQLIKN